MSTLSPEMVQAIRTWAGQKDNKDSAEGQTNKALKFQLLLIADLVQVMSELRDSFRTEKPSKKA